MLERRPERHFASGSCKIHKLYLVIWSMTISLTHWNKEQDIESPLRWSHFRSVPQSTTWRHEHKYPIPFHLGQVSRTAHGAGWRQRWTLGVATSLWKVEGVRISRSRHPDLEDFRGFANEEGEEVGRFENRTETTAQRQGREGAASGGKYERVDHRGSSEL